MGRGSNLGPSVCTSTNVVQPRTIRREKSCPYFDVGQKIRNLTVTVLVLRIESPSPPARKTTTTTTTSTTTTTQRSFRRMDENTNVIVHVSNEEEYLQALLDAKNGQLIVVDIFATWCPPCTQIAPIFEALARQYHPTTVFIKVDIDKFPGIKQHLSVWAMPTFYFLKKTNKTIATCTHECCQHEQPPPGIARRQDKATAVQVIGSFMGANERLLRRGLANDGIVGMCSSMCTIQ